MEKTKKKREQEEHEVVPEKKKSKITLYWESRNGTRGEILNMRQVLK